jgi:hypothetical protein
MSKDAWSPVMSLVAVLALAGCGNSPAGPGRTAAQSVVAGETEVGRSRSQESLSGTATACDGEVFNVTTVIDHQEHITRRTSGEWMFTQHSRWETDGVGTTTGARFIGRQNINTTQVFAALGEGGAQTFSSVFRMRNIVQGRADNAVLAVHAKWTINANGQTTVDLLPSQFEDCRG